MLRVAEAHSAQPRSVYGDARDGRRIDGHRVCPEFDEVGVFAEFDRPDAIVELTRDRAVDRHRSQGLIDADAQRRAEWSGSAKRHAGYRRLDVAQRLNVGGRVVRVHRPDEVASYRLSRVVDALRAGLA